MRTIDVLPDGKWSVHENGQCLFVGTRPQVEDWLDRLENVEADGQASPASTPRRQSIARFFSFTAARVLPKS